MMQLKCGHGMVLLLAAVLMSTGCTDKLKAERDRLYSQNLELQRRLSDALADRDAADARIRDLSAMADAAPASNEPMPVAMTPPAMANSGFSTIEGVEVAQSASGREIAVRVPGDVLFASGKVELRAEAKKTLTEIANVIKREYSGKRIRIEGYTDTDPIKRSGWKDNLQLSAERAGAVHRHLQEQGVPGESMDLVGRGQWHPRDSKSRSRRVEIVVVVTP